MISFAFLSKKKEDCLCQQSSLGIFIDGLFQNLCGIRLLLVFHTSRLCELIFFCNLTQVSYKCHSFTCVRYIKYTISTQF